MSKGCTGVSNKKTDKDACPLDQQPTHIDITQPLVDKPGMTNTLFKFTFFLVGQIIPAI